jgi:hypothetical protein
MQLFLEEKWLTHLSTPLRSEHSVSVNRPVVAKKVVCTTVEDRFRYSCVNMMLYKLLHDDSHYSLHELALTHIYVSALLCQRSNMVFTVEQRAYACLLQTRTGTL